MHSFPTKHTLKLEPETRKTRWKGNYHKCFVPYVLGEVKESESLSVVSDSLWPHGLYSPWNFPGQNTGVHRLSLLQGIFPTQGSNPGLPLSKPKQVTEGHCNWTHVLGWGGGSSRGFTSSRTRKKYALIRNAKESNMHQTRRWFLYVYTHLISNPHCETGIIMCCVCSVTQPCLTLCDPRSVIHQAPLSTEFSRQIYQGGLSFSLPGDPPDQGIEPLPSLSPALAGRFFTTESSGNPRNYCYS